MAKCWYQTPEWSEEDDKKLAGRMKRYKTAYDRIQTLRIKALHLLKSGNGALYPVGERLLTMAVNDPDLGKGELRDGDRCELSMCHDMLGQIAESEGDRTRAEYHYRKQIEVYASGTENRMVSVLNVGMRLAIFLSEEDDREKLREADRLLDQLKESESTLHLAFGSSKMWYCAAKARIAFKFEKWREAKAFAGAALGLNGAPGIDSFKKKPMDRPLLDETTRLEMQRIYDACAGASWKKLFFRLRG